MVEEATQLGIQDGKPFCATPRSRFWVAIIEGFRNPSRPAGCGDAADCCEACECVDWRVTMAERREAERWEGIGGRSPPDQLAESSANAGAGLLPGRLRFVTRV